MNTGKTLFAQVMFRILAFAQLTWRESLRDVEACLAANSPKLFHMGLRSAPARSTLADALNLRDWRIYQALALRLIARARALYADDRVLADLNAAVYALDSTTIGIVEIKNDRRMRDVQRRDLPLVWKGLRSPSA